MQNNRLYSIEVQDGRELGVEPRHLYHSLLFSLSEAEGLTEGGRLDSGMNSISSRRSIRVILARGVRWRNHRLVSRRVE